MPESIPTEEWRPFPGYEGRYEISDYGGARSLDRVIDRGPTGLLPIHGKVLKAWSDPKGYLRYGLGHRNVRLAHHLVLLTFIGPRPEGYIGCHKDGNPRNNRASNLYWGTYTDNAQDMIRHGTASWLSQTECKYGHDISDPENYYVILRNGTKIRSCKTCQHRRSAKYRARLKSQGLPQK